MTDPKRERTLYEISSSFFAAVVILFALVGAVVALGEDGLGSAGFVICCAFIVLGLGRLYLGLKRGNEGSGG